MSCFNPAEGMHHLPEELQSHVMQFTGDIWDQTFARRLLAINRVLGQTCPGFQPLTVSDVKGIVKCVKNNNIEKGILDEHVRADFIRSDLLSTFVEYVTNQGYVGQKEQKRNLVTDLVDELTRYSYIMHLYEGDDDEDDVMTGLTFNNPIDLTNGDDPGTTFDNPVDLTN